MMTTQIDAARRDRRHRDRVARVLRRQGCTLHKITGSGAPGLYFITDDDGVIASQIRLDRPMSGTASTAKGWDVLATIRHHVDRRG